jgi:hypothetical protein
VPSILNKEGEFLIDDEIVKNLTQEHITQVNKEYLIRKQGLTIRDKIDEKLVKFSSLDLRSSAVNDRYNTLDMRYSTDLLGDMKIFYKISEKFSPIEGEYLKCDDLLEENKFYIDTENEKSLISNNEIISVESNVKKGNKNPKGSMVQYDENEDEEEEEIVPKSIDYLFKFKFI